jgi:hypothetical protein
VDDEAVRQGAASDDEPGDAPARVEIDLHWGTQRELWASSFDTAEAVARALEDVLARKTSVLQSGGVAEEIERLSALASDGVITPEEFERGKQLFLGSPPDKAQETIRLLQQLHDLHRSGVLSESEFNLKKWDLLARS